MERRRRNSDESVATSNRTKLNTSEHIYDRKITNRNQTSDTYDSAEVAERGLAAPAFKRPTFRSILPMAVFKMAAACS